MSEVETKDKREVSRCGRPVYDSPAGVDPKPVCLMHTRDVAKDSVAFQKEVDVILKGAASAVADFTGFFFPDAGYARREFTAHCIFAGATFARSADFGNASFQKGADFKNVTFNAETVFSKAIFAQAVEFDGAIFVQDTYFRGSIFVDAATFNNAVFRQRADFGAAKFMRGAYFMGRVFTESVSFNWATFDQDAHFNRANFMQSSDFGRVTFLGSADFDGAVFVKNADFSRATFGRVADFSYAKFLEAAEFRETDFRRDDERVPGPVFCFVEFGKPEAVVFYGTYLGQALFHNCDVSKIAFSSVEWRQRKRSRKRMVFEEDVDLNHPSTQAMRPKHGSTDERDFGVINELYQCLTKNYDDRKDYWTAGDFHYGEMETKRLSMAPQRRIQSGLSSGDVGSGLWNRIRRWQHRRLSLLAWYKYASEYGESYGRPFSLLLFVLIIFAFLYVFVGVHPGLSKDSQVVSLPEPPATVALARPVKPVVDQAQAAQVLTFWEPFLPGEKRANPWHARAGLCGHTVITSVDIAAFQKEPFYTPVYPWGRVFSTLEMILTSVLLALFLLAVRRQFRR